MKQINTTDIPDIEKIQAAPRIILGKWPTPLTVLEKDRYILIKRDDLSGFGRGGVKTRKLEFMFGDYINRNIKDFVAVVPNISNLRADIERIAPELKINVHLIVANDPPREDRHFTDSAFVKYTLAGKSMFSSGLQLFKQYIKQRIKTKKRTALLLPGACHPSSVIGASNGLIELYQQCTTQNISIPEDIFISASSGASAAGLVLASLLLREKYGVIICIHVAQVYPIPLKWWIHFLLRWTKKRYQLSVRLKDLPLRIAKSDLPYGKATEELKAVCDNLKDSYNIRVDHIYGAHTWKSMTAYMNTKKQKEGSVFWHCGFTPDITPA